MKKLISVLLVVCIMMGICVTASADATDTYDLSTASKVSYLTTTSSGHVTCTSKFASSDSNIKSVQITQSLEKFAFLWFWNSVYKKNALHTDNSFTLINDYYGVESGTYRVKSVFTITMKSGKVETFTVYSSEKKVP